MRTGSGTWVYPVWQFNGGAVLPGLGPALRVLGGGDVSGWTVAGWLSSPEAELDGRTPVACLRAGDVDLVLLVASHAAAGWVGEVKDSPLVSSL